MIILYGKLRKKFGKYIDSNVTSVKEAIRAAEAMRPGFRAAIDRNRNYAIRCGDTLKGALNVAEDELDMIFSSTTWHILPLPIGCKAGVFQFILGAIITTIGIWYEPLIPIGVGLMIGGVAAMLAPTMPGLGQGSDADKNPSFVFDGPINQVNPGGAVPLVYGKDVFIGSIFTSGGISVGDIPA